MRSRVIAIVVDHKTGAWTPISRVAQARGLTGHVLMHPDASEEDAKEMRWCTASDSRLVFQFMPDLPRWTDPYREDRFLF